MDGITRMFPAAPFYEVVILLDLFFLIKYILRALFTRLLQLWL